MARTSMKDDVRNLLFGQLLDDVAGEASTPAGGSVAAIVTALAAGLVEMAARFAHASWAGAATAVSEAEALRESVVSLAVADAEAYEALLAARRSASTDAGPEQEHAVGAALARAVEVPLAIAETAAEVAEIGASVVVHGNPNLASDAAAGVVLADAAARIAADLVRVNLEPASDDERVTHAQALAALTSDAVQRVRAPRTP